MIREFEAETISHQTASSIIQSPGFRTSRRINRNPRICARFAHMCGPGEYLCQPKLVESGETYPGALLLGPWIIALHSPTGLGRLLSPKHCRVSKIDPRLGRARQSRVCRPAVPEAATSVPSFPNRNCLTIAAAQTAARRRPTRNFAGGVDSRAAGHAEHHLRSASRCNAERACARG